MYNFFYTQVFIVAPIVCRGCSVVFCVLSTILPAKSDSDVMFCLQSYHGHKSIDHLCINPIHRIGLIHKCSIDSR